MSSVETVERFQNGDAEIIEELVNGNELQEQINGDDNQQNAVRVIRKAKRFHRQNSGSDFQVSNGDSKGVAQAKQALAIRKNSRKSRDGRGRGLPKKGLQLLIRKCVIIIYNLIYIALKSLYIVM